MAKKEEDYTNEDRAALRALQQASERLKKATGGGTNGQAVENLYADAYRKCYSLGLRDYKLVTGLTTR